MVILFAFQIALVISDDSIDEESTDRKAKGKNNEYVSLELLSSITLDPEYEYIENAIVNVYFLLPFSASNFSSCEVPSKYNFDTKIIKQIEYKSAHRMKDCFGC